MQVRQIYNTAPSLLQRKKVAAYARVSSGKEAMIHSLSAQVSYYSAYIGNRPDWEYAGVFADEALTGTKESRPGFQQLLDACRVGNVQLILTKSISRFARNTVTVLESVRELRALGVDIFFEEQNIHSMSAEGELMLTILASFAQEESRSVSENVKWRVRKDFREGKVSGMVMLGYHLVNGVLTVIPEETEVVRAIFADYLSGMGITGIVKKFKAQGVKMSRAGLWTMLRNEKYQGDMLLQKRFTEDHIGKKQIKNVGQLPQFYVTDSHEPIIEKETFAKVQSEIARRAAKVKSTQPEKPRYPFTGLIHCGICGAPFKRKHANAGGKYEKIVWICSTFNDMGKAACDSQQIPEEILLAKTQEVGGLTAVREILIPGHNRLIILLKSGRRMDAEWQSPSRRQSWTPEMKEAARQRALKQHHGE